MFFHGIQTGFRNAFDAEPFTDFFCRSISVVVRAFAFDPSDLESCIGTAFQSSFATLVDKDSVPLYGYKLPSLNEFFRKCCKFVVEAKVGLVRLEI
jgi:hypothetical protein